MLALFVVGLQAVSGPQVSDAPRLRVVPECPKPDGSGDVVVCGRREEPFRLKPMAERYEDTLLPKAEIGIGGAKLTAEGEQGSVGGIPSPRAMIRLKVPF
jgi:hypothetical protein